MQKANARTLMYVSSRILGITSLGFGLANPAIRSALTKANLPALTSRTRLRQKINRDSICGRAAASHATLQIMSSPCYGSDQIARCGIESGFHLAIKIKAVVSSTRSGIKFARHTPRSRLRSRGCALSV